MGAVTKLSEIIDAATGDSVPVATLLRMVRVVASRIGTIQLEEWVARELSGYEPEHELPPCRGPFEAAVLGHFAGPFGSEMTIPIPPAALPNEYRDGWLFKLAFMQPVSELEGLRGANDTLRNMWKPDAVVLFNHLVSQSKAQGIEMHGLVEAWKVVTPQQVGGVLDQVRTRVLSLALELEKIAPQAGEVDAELPERSTVATVVNAHIYGSGNNIAVGSPHASLISTVQRGDLPSLLAAARDLGLSEAEVEALEQAILEDARADGRKHTPGSAVSTLIGRLALGAGSVTGKVAIGAASGTLAALTRAYFGIG